MKMITSKVIQVTWLTDQLNNPNNLHVLSKPKYSHCSFSRIGRKNEIDKLLAGLWTS